MVVREEMHTKACYVFIYWTRRGRIGSVFWYSSVCICSMIVFWYWDVGIHVEFIASDIDTGWILLWMMKLLLPSLGRGRRLHEPRPKMTRRLIMVFRCHGNGRNGGTGR